MISVSPDVSVKLADTFSSSDYNASTWTLCTSANLTGVVNVDSNFTCNAGSPVRGRYVSISRPGKEYLVICEVKIYDSNGKI